jgi:hypothetical protein
LVRAPKPDVLLLSLALALFLGLSALLALFARRMPSDFDLAAANLLEHRAAAEILERVSVEGHIVLADKGFAGREFEQLVTDLGGQPAPTARTKRRGLGRSAGCDSGWESYAGWGSSR